MERLETLNSSCWATILDRLSRTEAMAVLVQETRIKGQLELEEASRKAFRAGWKMAGGLGIITDCRRGWTYSALQNQPFVGLDVSSPAESGNRGTGRVQSCKMRHLRGWTRPAPQNPAITGLGVSSSPIVLKVGPAADFFRDGPPAKKV